ncbi:LysR family transcriptional regulator [Mesorhizobium sp.]|uniref:LysR family transcriptional regulator n=1 Tax=Mesorhizobium sp. TaxID=1871066 RepID=UPI000FE6DEA5|nr:LysR family transcriptional regulator [Mesorhizobium sp.]RWK94369.1 MAG: LysR family transcriptional regulator [Mesorhizobium sp.]TIQ27471.1 MAG: LysR family transcriptional regulator [Mesorhizobium sp.]
MVERIQSELLRTFLAVADTQSFTLGGERIGRTQSSVSTQMRKLEHSLKVNLFVRRPYGIALTKEGHALEAHSRRVITMLDATTDVISRSSLQGSVRIGIQEEYGSSILNAALAEFSQSQPKVDTVVRCLLASEKLAALEADELDLAVVFEPDELTQGTLLAKEATVWVTSMEHSPHLIHPVPVATYGNTKWSRDFAIPSLQRSGIKYRVSYISDTFGGFLTALRSGLAIVPLSRSVIPSGCRELTKVDGYREIDTCQVILHRNPRSQSTAVEAMWQALVTAFSQHTWRS